MNRLRAFEAALSRVDLSLYIGERLKQLETRDQIVRGVKPRLVFDREQPFTQKETAI